MGLLSRVRDGLIGSPEWRQRFRQQRREFVAAGKIEHAAREIAAENVPDEQARDQLRVQIADEHTATTAVEMLAPRRDSYIKDRAYRLLTAALDRTEVRSIDPALREDFLREEALGRMALEEAYHQLAELEPGLNDLESDTIGGDKWLDKKAVKRLHDQTHGLVGISARGEDPLLRSDLAASIVRQYLLVRSRRRPEDLRVPYFDRRITSSSSGNFFGGVERPRATN